MVWRNTTYRHFLNALTLSALLCVTNAPVNAVDNANRYIGYGPGGKHCSDIGAAIKAGHEPLFQAWLSGFVTSENYRLAGAKDILEDQDLPKAWRWVRRFCGTHGSAALADVAALLMLNRMDIIAARLKAQSDKIIVRQPLDAYARGY